MDAEGWTRLRKSRRWKRNSKSGGEDRYRFKKVEVVEKGEEEKLRRNSEYLGRRMLRV